MKKKTFHRIALLCFTSHRKSSKRCDLFVNFPLFFHGIIKGLLLSFLCLLIPVGFEKDLYCLGVIYFSSCAFPISVFSYHANQRSPKMCIFEVQMSLISIYAFMKINQVWSSISKFQLTTTCIVILEQLCS